MLSRLAVRAAEPSFFNMMGIRMMSGDFRLYNKSKSVTDAAEAAAIAEAPDAPRELHPGKTHEYMNKLAKRIHTEDQTGMATAPQVFKVPSIRPPGKKDDYFDPWENPERDYVNFPRMEMAEYPPPRRHAIWPESYFTWIYKSTGVTGPYVLPGVFFIFLLSKEITPIEHNLRQLFATTFVYWGVVRAVGPKMERKLEGMENEYEEQLRNLVEYERLYYQHEIEEEEMEQFTMGSFEEVIASKKEAVQLQLESEYRERVHTAHKEIKRKLDYQVATASVMRKAEQKHMVDWIITNVRKSITAKQEEEALRKCIADLKAMQAKQ